MSPARERMVRGMVGGDVSSRVQVRRPVHDQLGLLGSANEIFGRGDLCAER